jgi:hypothetical protein
LRAGLLFGAFIADASCVVGVSILGVTYQYDITLMAGCQDEARQCGPEPADPQV